MAFQIKYKGILLKYFLLSFIILNVQMAFANNSQVYIETITLQKHGVLIKFSGKTAFQTVQIDDYQILIALKGIISDPAIDEIINNSELIKQISFDKMAGDVNALVVYTNKEVKSYSAKWLDTENSLCVNLIKI